MELLLRAAISGVLIALASEAARRSSLFGAVMISLLLTSLLAIVWLYRDTRDTDEVSSFAWSILWIIPPSLFFFVALPVALGRGLSFAPAMRLAVGLTVARMESGSPAPNVRDRGLAQTVPYSASTMRTNSFVSP